MTGELAGRRASEPANRLVVVSYDKEWPRLFREIQMVLQTTLAGLYYRIEHVGSTSVPGMAAKPIIDIDIVMREGQFEGVRRLLEGLGYEHEGDLGTTGRESFRLTDPGMRSALMEHHLYVCDKDSAELKRHLAFRDYLIAHPEWAARLGEHKLALLPRYADDRQGYQDAKSAMVNEILNLALLEAPRQ